MTVSTSYSYIRKRSTEAILFHPYNVPLNLLLSGQLLSLSICFPVFFYSSIELYPFYNPLIVAGDRRSKELCSIELTVLPESVHSIHAIHLCYCFHHHFLTSEEAGSRCNSILILTGQPKPIHDYSKAGPTEFGGLTPREVCIGLQWGIISLSFGLISILESCYPGLHICLMYKSLQLFFKARPTLIKQSKAHLFRLLQGKWDFSTDWMFTLDIWQTAGTCVACCFPSVWPPILNSLV